jgi:hypothetical protein
MYPGAGRRHSLAQASRLLDIDERLRLDAFLRHPIAASVAMHLFQVRPVSNPPRLRQRARLRVVAYELGLVEKPRQLGSAAQAFLELDPVRAGRPGQREQIRRARLLNVRQ